jgi:hypothetical protein
MNKGFSFSSLVMGYFLVGGGMFAATLAAAYVPSTSEYVGYALIAAGAFVGGFIAARASPGATIIEPTIGAVAVVATIVGLAAGTQMGQAIWAQAHNETIKFVGFVGGASLVGAFLGAFLSERLLGEATRSSIPWIVYTGLSVFGGCLLAFLATAGLMLGDNPVARAGLDAAAVALIGVGVGCLLAGLATGASARTRPLIAAFLGGGLGVAGFFWLLARTQSTPERDNLIGLAVIAVGGAIVTLIGTAIGWGVVGKRAAG